MNRLINKAPQTVSIDGVDYSINTDFRDCLLTIAAIEDPELTQNEKIELVLSNMYGDSWPEDTAKAIKQALWVLSGGRAPDEKEHPRLADFEQDADMIYAAMLKKGIDLDAANMHWWKFLSHYQELPESAFTRVVYLRMQHRKGKLSKDERKECDRIGWDVINLKLKDPNIPDDETIWAMLNGEI